MQGWARRGLVIFGGAAGTPDVYPTAVSAICLAQLGNHGDLQAWLALLWDRLVVAMTMAAMLATLGQMQLGPSLPRYVLAVSGGAALGEWILLLYGTFDDRQDLVLGRVVLARRGSADHRHPGSSDRGGPVPPPRRDDPSWNLAATDRAAFSAEHLGDDTASASNRYQRGQHFLGRLCHYMSATLSDAAGTVPTL